MAPDAARSLREKIQKVSKAWEVEIARPRSEASRKALQESISDIGILAVGTSLNRMRLV